MSRRPSGRRRAATSIAGPQGRRKREPRLGRGDAREEVDAAAVSGNPGGGGSPKVGGDKAPDQGAATLGRR